MIYLCYDSSIYENTRAIKHIFESDGEIMLEQAKKRLQQGDVTCVVVNHGEILHALSGMGIKPILTVLRQSPQDLQGAAVADKVIGRAAATALVRAGVGQVYGQIMSEHGKARLESFGVTAAWGQLVERIDNRDGTDMCPLEKASFASDDLDESFASMMAFIEEKMKAAQA